MIIKISGQFCSFFLLSYEHLACRECFNQLTKWNDRNDSNKILDGKIYKEMVLLLLSADSTANAQRQRSRKIKVDEDYFESCIDAFQRSELEF